MKRIILILLPLIATVLMIVALYRYFKPDLDRFVTRKIKGLSAQYLAMEVTAEHFDFHLFTPTLELTGLKVIPRDPKLLGFKILEINSISAQLDFLQLLGGKLVISTIQIDKPTANINLDSFLDSSDAPTKINLDPFFRQLRILPFRQILISELESELSATQPRMNISIKKTNFLIINQGDRLILETEISAETVEYKKIKENFYIEAGFVLSRNLLDIRKVHVRGLQSDLTAAGAITDIQNILTNPTGRAHFEFQTDLPQLREKIKPLLNLPPLSGKTRIVSDFDFNNKIIQQGALQLLGEDLSIDDFEIGKIKLNGQWKNNAFHSTQISITNKAASVDLKDLSIDLKFEEQKPHIELRTKLQTEKLDLHQLLKLVKVGDIPVELLISGNLNCVGPLYPQFMLNCKGALHGENLIVRRDLSSEKEKNIILQINDFSATGEAIIDTEKVSYKSDITAIEGKGTSDGVISYDTGFDIQYATPTLNFKSITNLSNLKIQGNAKMSGRTTGDSNHAIFFIDVDGKDIWFEDYFLGHPKVNVSYEKGNLKFNHINSTIVSSHYTGDVSVDLIKPSIQIQAQASNLEVSDALRIFQKKLVLPVDFTGTANLSVNAEGPLDFSSLSYKFISQTNRGTIAGEGYDQIDFNVSSDKGEVKSEKIILKKGNGLFIGQGRAHPSGQIQFNLAGNNFLLEESETISKFGANISGQLQMSLGLKGHILHPDVSITSRLDNFAIEDQSFPASTAQVKLNSNQINGKMNFFEGKLKSELLYSFSEQDPFKLQVIARDWDYSTLLALAGDNTLLSEYQASLTGDLDLHSENGGIFKSTGQGSIDRIFLSRGTQSLSNPVPITITLNNGQLALKNSRVRGGDNYIELKTENSSKNQLAMKLEGKTQLRLFQIFTPFLDELAGLANFEVTISGKTEKPEILGSASLESGYLKLKNFPHAFEKINAKAQFSQSKIFISDCLGQFAGGQLKADGELTLEGLKNYPMNFKAQITNLSMNVPDKIHTTGSAELVLTGNWFPFLLSGTYNITSGLIDKEFAEDTMGTLAKQSNYLPKSILQTSFDPIHLDLQVQVNKPLLIKNSILDGSVRGTIQVKGTATQPSLSGKVTTEKNSKLTFRDKIFDVTSANVNFTDSVEINPELYVSASSRISDYDINLLIQGTAKSPLVRLTSTPPLPEQDIASLIALGMLTGTTNKITTQQKDQQQQNTTQIGLAVQQLLSAKVQKEFNVDIQISSQYDDTKNISTQKYTFQKRMQNKIILSGTITRGDLNAQELKLRYSFNPNISASASIENTEGAQVGTTTYKQGQILGLDLEFKKEFKW